MNPSSGDSKFHASRCPVSEDVLGEEISFPCHCNLQSSPFQPSHTYVFGAAIVGDSSLEGPSGDSPFSASTEEKWASL
ncbi:hypothetical protein TNCV_3903331 [Trichonephila clavipes]|nr:hypothetical protein TNCV_3903331 [Trichonephila clavipes]